MAAAEVAIVIEVANLDSTLRRLESFGVRLGLKTTRRLLAALGDPQKRVRSVLIAGTNGKGSTAALLASMATAAGYRTGLYSSPHLESVEERIRIGGRVVPSERLSRWVHTVVKTCESSLGYPPTYFEALTAAAFSIFAEDTVELAVLEVGLGGRLDATNAADPELSLITEIGLEHQDYLGESLGSIAREKAGILRRGKPAIAWVKRPEARHAIEAAAREIGAGLVWGPELVSVGKVRLRGRQGQRIELRTSATHHDLSLSLLGEHQRANLALAVLAAESLERRGFERLTATAIARGAAATRWPGRLEWVDLPVARSVLLDVAHNPDAAAALARALRDQSGRYVLLFGALSSKRVEAVLPPLAEGAATVVLTTPRSARATSPDRLAALVDRRGTVVEPDRRVALSTALAARGGFVVVCGSVYLVGAVRVELRKRFGVPRPAIAVACSG